MSKKKIIFYSIFILFLSSCKYNNKGAELQTSFFCDTETYNLKKDLVDSKNKNLIFNGKSLLSNEAYLSGKTSLKLTKDKKYAFGFEIPNLKTDNFYKVSVWMKGDPKELNLVAQGANFYKTSNKVIKTNDNGWKLIKLSFTVPPNFNTNEKIKVFAWNTGKKTIYVDNFKIEQISNEVTHTYKEEPLRIYIEETELKKLKEIRKNAFNKKVLETTDDSWVSAIIFYGEEKYKAKLRFKGDWLDHLQGFKWSFRIKLKKNGSFKGMREFSIQSPAARYFIDEWLAHRIFEKEDVLTTRYDFVPVYLNGKNLGLYVYEEHFVKQLIENKKRREGPIIKFSEDQMWKARVYGADGDYPIYLASKIKPFKAGKTISDKKLKTQFIIAQNLLNKYKFLTNEISNIFDVEKTAKYFAIVDLTRAYHGLIWHNQRFYYNPVISKIEPIAYDNYCDAGVMQWTKNAIYGNRNILDIDKEPNGFNNLLFIFRNKNFVDKYLFYLKKYSDEKYIATILQKYDKDISYFKEILKYEFPDYNFDSNFLTSNSNSIRKELPEYIERIKKQQKQTYEEPKFVHNKKYSPKYISEIVPLYIKAWKNNNKISVTNYYPNNIELLGISIHKKIISEPFSKRITLSYFQTYNFTTDIEGKLYLYFKVKDEKDIFTIEISNYPPPTDFNPAQQLLKEFNFKNNDYYTINDNRIIFKKGKQVITKNIVIPKGYKVIFNEGVDLDFTKKSLFISYSPVYINGTDKNKVIFKSSDGTAQGFTVLQANKKSIIKNAIFTNLNTLNYKGWTLTGAINFYESDVDIKNTSFENNYCEDALNIVRSNFNVDNCIFKNIFSDAFDSDFCTGKLTNTKFNTIGNDAIDFSGSEVEINNCNIQNVKDKGISGGENSTLNVNNCFVTNSQIGFASKDKSALTLNSCRVENSKYGLVALQKKPEYDFATIIAKNFTWNNIIELYAIEKKSKLNLNNKTINGSIKKLAKRFY